MRRNTTGTMTARACLVLAAWVATSGLALAEVGRYVGIQTCSSTNCHGYAEPHSERKVNQNEAFLWENKDKQIGRASCRERV